jgi:hypothetical protein
MSDVFSPPQRVTVESHCKDMDSYNLLYRWVGRNLNFLILEHVSSSDIHDLEKSIK